MTQPAEQFTSFSPSDSPLPPPTGRTRVQNPFEKTTVHVGTGNTSALSSPSTSTEPSQWIALKFDDRIFNVQRSTLLGVPGTMFTTLFGQSEDGEPPSGYIVCRDESVPSRPYLFDRNPKYFEPVLNFLRTGEVIIDPGVNPEGVVAEAEYFCVMPMVEQLRQTSHGRRSEGQLTCTRQELERALLTTTGQSGGLRLQGTNFAGFDFSNMDLSNINFSRCNLSGASFRGADLTGAKLMQCAADHADFTSATLSRAILDESDLAGAIFEAAVCAEASFRRAKCMGGRFLACILTHAHMEGVDLTNADLTGSRLQGAYLSGACLKGVERQGTTLTMGGLLA